MSVNEKNAYNITKRLAFPRLVGTPGEKEAINIVEDEFKKAGYDSVIKEEFKTSLYNWIVARWVFIPIGLLFVLIAYMFLINLWITLLLLCIFMIISLKALSLMGSQEIKLSRNENHNFITENLYVNLMSKNSKAKVIIMAHHDSKGQSFPKHITIIIYIVVIFGFLIMFFLYLILSIIRIFFVFENQFLFILMFIISVILAVLGSLNFFNKTNNVSQGAADDAAGVGAVIEMARYFKENSPENIDITFLATGSEELNLGGAKDFIAKHKDQLDPNSTFFINLDCFGGGGTFKLIKSFGIPKKTGSKLLNDLFIKTGKELNIPIKEIYLPSGAWSDFMPMVGKGFQACWIDGLGKGVRIVHTKKDNMSVIKQEGLKKGILLCIEVLKKLEKESVSI